jgi:hypothetical protein
MDNIAFRFVVENYPDGGNYHHKHHSWYKDHHIKRVHLYTPNQCWIQLVSILEQMPG